VTSAGERELVVRCMTHGLMKYDEQRRCWVCLGWDGEGCQTVTTDETVAQLRAAAALSPAPGDG
jgi:hypothetical protein